MSTATETHTHDRDWVFDDVTGTSDGDEGDRYEVRAVVAPCWQAVEIGPYESNKRPTMTLNAPAARTLARILLEAAELLEAAHR